MEKQENIKKDFKTIISAERRRLICLFINNRGSANANELANEMGVTTATIRNDLNILHEQGKLVRTHGGAVIKVEESTLRPAYFDTREKNMLQKQLIAQEALKFLPSSGSIFISSGSTLIEFSKLLSLTREVQVITNSVPVAEIVTNKNITSVHFVGGTIRPESCSSDCSIPENVLNGLHWETLFIGIAAIDPIHGISTLEPSVARLDRKLMQHGGKVVALCDSSKIGCYALANIGSVSMIDVLITDAGISQEITKALIEESIQVVIADERTE